jgi:thymidine phosphorylase
MAVTMALGVEMLLVSGLTDHPADARSQLEETIQSGAALARFREMVGAQGGDPGVVDDPARLARAPVIRELRADHDGVIAAVEPRIIGHAVVSLGGGRARTTDQVDPAVGFLIPAKPGIPVARGDLLGTVHARDEAGAALGLEALRQAIVTGSEGRATPLISHRVSAAGVEALT